MADRCATAPRSITSCGFGGAEHCKTGLAAGIYVGMIAENGQRMGRYSSGQIHG